MPRFVILEHDHPTLHWDLMLEVGERLRTWRLATAPDSAKVIPAEAIGDHRLLYLEYEGPVSGNRGRVRRWEAGNYITEEESADRLTVTLAGDRVRGKAVLRKGNGVDWSFEWQPGS
jgi:hypothetical protein